MVKPTKGWPAPPPPDKEKQARIKMYEAATEVLLALKYGIRLLCETAEREYAKKAGR